MKKDLKTTIASILEATFMNIVALEMFDLTWQQRGIVFALSLCRAASGYFAKDAEPEKK
jgi:hypothetical protein